MRSINAQSWERKPGARYVEKFKEMQASAREFDQSENDHNDEVDQVHFKSGAEQATVHLAPNATMVRLKKTTTNFNRSAETSETQNRSVHMEQMSDTTLFVIENNDTVRRDVGHYPGKTGDDVIGKGNWHRSFSVDMESGMILSDKPNIGDLLY